jgi:hypothetical protein
MDKRIKRRIGVLGILGMLVLMAISGTIIAASWGTTVTDNAGYRIIIDNDNGASDEAFAVWHDGTGGSELFRVQEDGNFGINNIDPTRKLEITDATNPELRLSDSVSSYTDISNVGSGYLYINPSFDRVGIEVASPSTTLHVGGDVAFDAGSTLTISLGAVTATHSYHQIDTAGGAADLNTISGGSVAGEILIIRSVNSGRIVTAKDNIGNLQLAGDFALNDPNDTLTLMYDGTNWLELSRSNNS